MSRIGKEPIHIPASVTVTKTDGCVVVKGEKGQLSYRLPEQSIDVTIQGDILTVTNSSTSKKTNALFGTVRALIANMVTGVCSGWTRTLELVGVGYKAVLTGNDLVLSVGFSHTVTVTPPAGITFTVKEGKIIVTGIDKQAVGQTAANIRAIRKPEPYKGKGIRFQGEYIRKKAGKTAKAVGGAGTAGAK